MRRRKVRALSDREVASSRAYRRVVEKLMAIVRREILHAFKGPRNDADEQLELFGAANRIRQLDLELVLKKKITREIPTVLLAAARKTSSAVRRQLVKATGAPKIVASRLGIEGEHLVGISIRLAESERELLSTFAAEGVDLITTMTGDLLRDLPDKIEEFARQGKRHEALKGSIKGGLVEDVNGYVVGTLNSASRHAKLIARDQVAKLNGKLTEHLQTKAGVSEYRWSASHDERVRPSHAAADGKVYRWDGPGAPDAGPYGEPAHPGEGIQCRCTAIPIIPKSWG